MSRWVVAAAVAAALLAAILGVIWTLQRRLIYFPGAILPAPGEIGLAGVEEVTLRTADGLDLGAWFLGVPGASSPITVVVFSGNAGNRAYRAPLGAALRRHGIQVLLVDYRGYGGNPGTPTAAGLAADSRAARAWLASRPDVDPSRVVYFGESLGTAVAVDLAAEYPPAGLILRSPFTSMADVGQFHYPLLPVRLLLRDRFGAVDQIRQVRAPLLVIAGSDDGIVPLAISRQLFEAAGEPKQMVVIPGADHNDYDLLAGEQMIAAIVAFVDALRR